VKAARDGGGRARMGAGETVGVVGDERRALGTVPNTRCGEGAKGSTKRANKARRR
jgi:hypothetical protein